MIGIPTIRKWGITALVLIAAFAPRGYEIGAYLPDYYHPDEEKEIRRAINACRGEFDQVRMHKGGLFVLLAFEYASYYGFMNLIGEISDPEEFALAIADDPSVLFFLSRLTVALLGAFSALLAYRIARSLGGTLAGLLAASLVAFFSFHLELSRLGRLDVPATFCVLLLMDLSLNALRSPSTRRMMLLTIAAALVVSTKTSGAPYLIIAVPPFLKWLMAARGSAAVGRLASSVAVALGTVAVFNVALPIGIASGQTGTPSPQMLAAQYGGAVPSKFENYIAQPAELLGPTAIVAVLIGMVLLLRAGDRQIAQTVSLWLAGIVAQILLLWLLTEMVNTRYILPAMVVCLIIAGLGASRLANLAKNPWPRRVAITAVSSILLIPSLLKSLEFWKSERLTPTSVAAKEWIETHIPSNSGFALQGSRIFPHPHMPPLRYTCETLSEKIENLEPIDHKKAATLRRYFLSSRTDEGYQVMLYNYRETGLPTLVDFRARDIRYVVLWELFESPPKESDLGKSYERFREFCEPNGNVIKIFQSDGAKLRGNKLLIYDLG